MLLAMAALAAVTFAPQSAAAPAPEVTVLKAGLGPCSADFTVKDASGAPIYAATVHVKVRYGVWNVKRSDLQVGTSADGRARIEGLPDKARFLHYDVRHARGKATAEQDVSVRCQAEFDLSLK